MTKYIYLDTVVKYNSEVFVLDYFQCPVLLLLLHYISEHFHTFTQVHFEFKTLTCSGVFPHCSIDTFTQVKNLNTFYNTALNISLFSLGIDSRHRRLDRIVVCSCVLMDMTGYIN